MVTAELKTANVDYLQQRNFQLSGVSAYPVGSPSLLIRVSGVLHYITSLRTLGVRYIVLLSLANVRIIQSSSLQLGQLNALYRVRLKDSSGFKQLYIR
jgi:hypothetical protein